MSTATEPAGDMRTVDRHRAGLTGYAALYTARA